MAQPGKPSSLLKPTLDTHFYIDYDWWEKDPEDLRTYLISHVRPEERERLTQSGDASVIDHIDPETGEVLQLDELKYALRVAAEEPDFINPQTSLVDTVFRVFLANNNTPLTPKQLEEKTNRSASSILKTFGGIRIYRGIRPRL